MDVLKAYFPLAARVLLGVLFLAAGMVGLFNLAPPPPDLPENLQLFNAGLAASGYFMTVLKLTEIVCGLLLISGYFVPLALVILAPIVLNIFFVHLFMFPDGLPVAIVAGLLLVYLSFFAMPYSMTVKLLFKTK